MCTRGLDQINNLNVSRTVDIVYFIQFIEITYMSWTFFVPSDDREGYRACHSVRLRRPRRRTKYDYVFVKRESLHVHINLGFEIDCISNWWFSPFWLSVPKQTSNDQAWPRCASRVAVTVTTEHTGLLFVGSKSVFRSDFNTRATITISLAAVFEC